MNATETIYHVDEIKNLSDRELYQRLYESWNITNGEIKIWGRLKLRNDGRWASIEEVRTTTENREINYPLDEYIKLDPYIYVEYAKQILGDNQSIFIKCSLSLSPERERIRHNNPFQMAVKIGSVEILESIPINKNDILESDCESYIAKAIYNFELSKLTKDIVKKEIALQESLKSLEAKKTQEDIEINKLAKQKSILEENSSQLKSDIDIQNKKLITAIDQHEKEIQKMSKKIEKLKSYIAEKAIFLKKFEFIDDDDFDEISINIVPEFNKIETLSFSSDFNLDYKQAVFYIQSYLKNMDILYPRHIIENYLTLIRTNDLIILAGDSGSGKTNLVQSFAKAVGGVAKIIPVKPNWTSSEDLLGYYNPLEKKYLATPFLEALIEAQNNPDIPYFICLDEMNLARVEFYFADFLSKLESRDSNPEIQLYSDDESAHIFSELKAVVTVISEAEKKHSQDGIIDFIKLVQNENINSEMKRIFGFSEKDSIIKYHGDIRRMLSGVIRTPSKIKMPANVRIIGTVNIDETTHYLSPKILDRAHIMKFKSPLLSDWQSISSEIESYGFENVSKSLHFDINDLGIREAYPRFDNEDKFCQIFIDLNKEFFSPLGVEFGMRTIRQGLNYLKLFSDLNENNEQAINNFIIHKILPKFTFDGNKQSGNQNKLDLIDKVMLPKLENIIRTHNLITDEFSSVVALKNIIANARANDGVVNYWA
ncbi:AAA family ATPase [Thiothrix unzii]|uniref:AAA family ATPase n=1 Tax=Thiothrix unzii TaxID=111769 RepID=A0A975FBA4_9GAMM|nr:AAA family ATPase [Thiothrix unzii]QTR54344.1 AAA family ATPase [Thiothrix unzii]